MKRIFILFAIILLSLCIFTNDSSAKGLTAEKFTEIVEKHNFEINKEIPEDEKIEFKNNGLISYIEALKENVGAKNEKSDFLINFTFLEFDNEENAIRSYNRYKDNIKHNFLIDAFSDETIRNSFCQKSISQKFNGAKVCAIINPLAHKHDLYMVTSIIQKNNILIINTVVLFGIKTEDTTPEKLQKRDEIKEIQELNEEFAKEFKNIL
ncbi:hypothetical protein IJJ97_05180 [bacterium]|nr:hypothetical protein [bacterium]